MFQVTALLNCERREKKERERNKKGRQKDGKERNFFFLFSLTFRPLKSSLP